MSTELQSYPMLFQVERPETGVSGTRRKLLKYKGKIMYHCELGTLRWTQSSLHFRQWYHGRGTHGLLGSRQTHQRNNEGVGEMHARYAKNGACKKYKRGLRITVGEG